MKVYAQSQPAKHVPYLHLAYTAAVSAVDTFFIGALIVGLSLVSLRIEWNRHDTRKNLNGLLPVFSALAAIIGILIVFPRSAGFAVFAITTLIAWQQRRTILGKIGLVVMAILWMADWIYACCQVGK